MLIELTRRRDSMTLSINLALVLSLQSASLQRIQLSKTGYWKKCTLNNSSASVICG